MSILPKSEFAQVNGEIYKITNTVTNKCYIGQTQHLEKKFRMLMHAEIDETSPMNHIKIKRNATTGLEYVQLTFKNASTTFVGKYEGIEDIRKRALCFLEELIKRRRDQIAGSPLEPSLPLPDGNVLEELG